VFCAQLTRDLFAIAKFLLFYIIDCKCSFNFCLKTLVEIVDYG